MNKYKSLSVLGLAVLLLAACASSDNGGIFGGGSNQSNYEIRGTVDSVDVNSRSIYLRDVSGYNTSMLSGGGNSVRVYYDDRTTVAYQGQSYRPQDLERGDEIAVRVDESGNSLVANAVTVTRDVSTSGSVYDNGSSQYATVRGTVRYVDTARRTIELESASWISGFNSGNTGSRMTFQYDTNASVNVSGQLYPVANLEAGDIVEVQFRNSNSTLPFLDRITLVRDVRR